MDHSNPDLALRHHPASTTFYFWMLTFPIISVADAFFLLWNTVKYLMFSVISVCYKSAASFIIPISHWVAEAILSIDLCGSLAFEKERSEKAQKRESMKIRWAVDTDHLQ